MIKQDPARSRWFHLGVAAIYVFVLGAFVWPGVYGAVSGQPVPAPSPMGTWGGWILRWMGVAVGGYGIAGIVIRFLRRRKRDS